jgi:vacuolar-type H+-ATPase subunit I/STV1
MEKHERRRLILDRMTAINTEMDEQCKLTGPESIHRLADLDREYRLLKSRLDQVDRGPLIDQGERHVIIDRIAAIDAELTQLKSEVDPESVHRAEVLDREWHKLKTMLSADKIARRHLLEAQIASVRRQLAELRQAKADRLKKIESLVDELHRLSSPSE